MTTLAQFDANAEGQEILGYLAWFATAAGVLGLITVGTMLALQVYSGQPGEGGMYMKQLYYVLAGCVLAATAGPIVAFLKLGAL